MKPAWFWIESSRRLALVVVVAACSRKSLPPPPCEGTITDAANRIRAESKKVELASTIDRTRLTMIASCEAEKWPAEVMGCIASARLEVDLASCTEKLTHEQYERLTKKLAKLVPDAGVADVVDAAVVVRPDATVIDHAPPDADVRAPSDAQVIRAPRDAADLKPKLDCSKAVLDPRDPLCKKQFCTAHPYEARCDAE